ncbi:nuclear transport factor 2 family protein [Shinella sp. PSBB067]|uniref:nuclear transport factor 2 family protein n=1 Tax=Shinella sp. PSBB067 TaxID=2715959 RepID=UPI00193C1B53|nr:nuclear transport factor 2 family protein [Shinella sp. PSBB067]QRI64140.1 nuclear transport factor 2 family protein [Shinella sp. PSBB067]
METAVGKLFERYERLFNRSLGGKADMDELVSLYACEFIGAAPAGVRTGKNDAQFRRALADGYARYRAIGTKAMRIRTIRFSPMDTLHCVAHVSWVATYARKDQPDVTVDFDVHYLVRMLDGEATVFGWVTGDEQALLEKHGIV